MKLMSDNQLLNRLDSSQGGVYAKADLQTTLAEPHPAAFGRRIRSLIEYGVLLFHSGPTFEGSATEKTGSETH